MSKNVIKKLILEVLAAEQEPVTGKHFQADLAFLKDYKQINAKVINGANTWKFEFKTSDNSYTSHVFLVEYPNSVYKMRLEVDWKITTRHNTAGAGKDFVMSFGPYPDYQTMVEEINRRLNNNPLIGSNLYNDNNDSMLDREIVLLLKRLRNSIGEIKALNHPALKTLEKINDTISDIPEDGLMKFCDDNFKGWLTKQGVIYKLQTLDNLPYYKSLRSDMHAPRSEPFTTNH